MIYKMWDGRFFAATDATDLVTQMRNSSFTPSEHISEYMSQFQYRLDLLKGKFVRSDTPENFLNDLIGFNIIRVQTVN